MKTFGILLTGHNVLCSKKALTELFLLSCRPMRQLRLTRPPAYDTAAQAEAWQLLLYLPIPPDLPAFTHEAFSEQGRRFILAVAQQYPRYSLP